VNNVICFQVVDIETGQRLGPNQVGQLCVKSPCLMTGYLGRDKETHEFFDTEQFAKLSDLVFYDKDGNIFHQGRTNDAIK